MATITEDYVSFETAKLLKEKGFLKGVDLRMTQNLSFYDNIGLSHNLNKYYDRLIQDKIDFVIAPTLQMAMKWLREVHNIDIIAPPQYDSIKWTYSAIIFKLSIPCTEIRLNDNKNKKEEAYETAIKYCLEHLI